MWRFLAAARTILRARACETYIWPSGMSRDAHRTGRDANFYMVHDW